MLFVQEGGFGPIGQTAVRLLEKAPYSIKARLYSGEQAYKQAAEHGIQLGKKAESFGLTVLGDVALLLGSDETGLLYATYTLIDALSANGGSISGVSADSQEPFTKTRGLYKFIHNEDNEKDWFYSKDYWLWWFDSMAQNRYNSFNIVFSHQTYYLAPMFAYFIEMPEFPSVLPIDATQQEIRRNHDMLQFISKTAAERGITLIIGIWQMWAWKGEDVNWTMSQPGTVKGLNKDNLEVYTYTAMKKMIEQFPNIGGLQIRANEESGIVRSEQADFYKNSLFKAMAEADRPFIFDFRCWLAEEETIQNALSMVPGTRLSVKYWAEFMGGPYQPAKISPGYSYSDYLRLPLKTDFIYQVWSLGSPRLFVWGDPDYVRRFVHSLTLGGGTGFEINLQLAQKGYGNEPGAWRIFKDSEKEYYKWEDERYWLFMTLFGRLSYDPNASEDIWMAPMRARFGDKAEQIMAAVKAGSLTLPYLVQASLSDPNMYIWPEIDLGGMLDFYMQTNTSDSCSIDTVPQYVDRWLAGESSGLFSPQESSKYFAEIAKNTFLALKGLEDVAEDSKELFATVLDMKASAFLAQYHSHKILAALNLKLYYGTRDRSVLRKSLKEIRKATVCWEQLIALTQEHYYENMVTGPTDSGCWKTKLTMLYEDELRVAELLSLSEKTGNFFKGFDFGAKLQKVPYRTHGDYPVFTDYSLERGYSLISDETVYTAETGYGWTQGQECIEVIKMPLVRIMDNHIDPLQRDGFIRLPTEKMKGWRNSLTEDGIKGASPAKLRVDLPDGRYRVSLIIADETVNARCHGPMDIKIGDSSFNGISVLPLEEKRICSDITVNGSTGGNLEISLSGDWFVSGLLIYSYAPAIASLPCPVIDCGSNVLSATVTAPSGIASVELVLDGTVYPMTYLRPDEYQIELDKLVKDKGSYFVRAKDKDGVSSETKPLAYLRRSKCSDISVSHQPVCSAPLDKSIKIAAKITSENPLKAVNLCYSAVNQYIPVTKTAMKQENGMWIAEIPASAFDPKWDILYFIEAVDIYGSGVIYPDFRENTPYYAIKMER